MNSNTEINNTDWSSKVTIELPVWIFILIPVAMLFALGILDMILSIGLLYLFNSEQFKAKALPYTQGKWRVFWNVVFILNLFYVPYLMWMNAKN